MILKIHQSSVYCNSTVFAKSILKSMKPTSFLFGGHIRRHSSAFVRVSFFCLCFRLQYYDSKHING